MKGSSSNKQVKRAYDDASLQQDSLFLTVPSANVLCDFQNSYRTQKLLECGFVGCWPGGPKDPSYSSASEIILTASPSSCNSRTREIYLHIAAEVSNNPSGIQ